jgi:hypothetical protein
VTNPGDRSVTHKEGGKKLKYKSLCVEIKRTWKMKCVIIPAIIGVTGIATEGLKRNVEVIPGKQSTYSLQKTAGLGTSHITRKVLHSETGRLSGEDRRWFKGRRIREKGPVTRDMLIIIIIIIIIYEENIR